MKKIYILAVLAFALFGFVSAASAQDLLTYNLKLGMKADAQVAIMQNLLMSKGFLGSGNSTGNFGPLTFAAVRTYQASNAIDSTGFVGPITRASMNAQLSGGAVYNPGTTTYLPGCSSYVGYSVLTGVSCATAQQQQPVTSGLMVSPVQISGVGSGSAYLSSTYSAATSGYYTVRFEYTIVPTGFNSALQSTIGQIILNGVSGSFSASMTNLIPGQTYYVRAVASGGSYGTVTSNITSFTATGSSYNQTITTNYQNQNTVTTAQPYVSTDTPYSLTSTSVTVSGSYDGRGYDTSVYFQYWYGQSAVVTTNMTSAGTGSGTSSVNLTGLVPNTTYNYRFVAVNGYGVSYGTTMTFTTLTSGNNNNNNNTVVTNSCTGSLPYVAGSIASDSPSGTVMVSQSQAPLVTFNLMSDCDASLKSITFNSTPAATWSTLNGYKVYLANNNTVIAGTFSGSTFTLTTPMVIPGGGSLKIMLKGNTSTTGSGSFRFGLDSVVAQSSAGVVNQYSTALSGNPLTYTTNTTNTNTNSTH